MSGTETNTAAASPARWRALLALFGVAMFAIGVAVGGLVLPRLIKLAPATPPQAATVAQVPSVTTTAPAAMLMPTVAPTITSPPSVTAATTAAAPPPTATPTAVPTPTVVPTPTAAPTSPSSIFAPDPTTTATSNGTTPTAAATSTMVPTPIDTATAAVPEALATVTPTTVPTATATAPSSTFAATDRIDTQLPVNFRAGPGTTYTAQAALPPGTLLAATGEAQTVGGVLWQQFRLANGTIGWVRAQDVSPLP